jgi:predicted Zn-dependent peptidase
VIPRRPKASLLAAACAWAVLASCGGARAEVVRRELPGGLTLVIRENAATPAVAVSIVVRMGSRWEYQDNAGVSNLLQHVMVKGTATRSALAIADEAERMGGSVSASGDVDHSEIRGTALGRHWRGLLALMADVALHPSLPPEEIDNERRAVSSGLRNRRDQPFQFTYDALIARLFPGHPYGVPALGREEVVARLDRDALLAHYRRFYRGDRVVVSLSGDVRAGEVASEVRRLFAALPAGDGDAEAPLPAAVPALARAVVTRPAAQAQILMGYLAPPIGHPDYAAMKVLQTALGGGMSGRLFAELRDRQGLAYSTGAAYPARTGQSLLVAFIGTAPANAQRSEEAMSQQMDRMAAQRLSEAELERAKRYLLGQFDLDRRTNARLAWYAAYFEVAGVGQGFAEVYMRAVESVTLEDVQRVARTYMGAPTVVRLEPAPR